MQIDIPTLETDRLTLLPPQLHHVEAYARLYGDPRVMQHIGLPLDESGALRVLASHAGQWVLHGFGSWCIEEKRSRAIVGIAGLLRRPEGGGEVEIGWVFGPATWGQGYAGEAARAILSFAFERARAERVLARIARENAASISLALRLGMQLAPESADAPTQRYFALPAGKGKLE